MATASTTSTVTSVSTQYPADMIGVDGDPVRLTWTIESSEPGVQTGSHIQVCSDPNFQNSVAELTIRGAQQLAVLAPGPGFKSREIRYYRVRAAIDEEWTAWSDSCSIEIGLLVAADWQANAITLAGDPGDRVMSPSPILRTEFELDQPFKSARLYVTSLGVNHITLNGRTVSDDVLAPGWSSYNQRLIASTYDITDQLSLGTNCLAGILGDGWYRGRLGWVPGDDRCHYGTEVGLLAQLEVIGNDGTTTTIATDRTWTASTGSIRHSDIYDGCKIDLNDEPAGWTLAGFDDTAWPTAKQVDLDLALIEPWISAPIRPVRILDVKLSKSSSGITRIDVGQNISGYLVIDVRGQQGQEVSTHHAEVVEQDGSLHLASLRSAKASDHFVLDGSDLTTLQPVFTFHGFRYADITTDARIIKVTAVAISSDLPERSSFSCSHQGLNQFESNVRWSQRDNFVGLPTDCPQRDERLGWTGDAQAFAATANTLFDSHQFWLNWFRDVALDQTDEGVPSVVPNVVLDGQASIGRAGWADVVTVAPWAAFQAYGSAASLHQQFPSMERWIKTLEAKRTDNGLLGHEFQFGDWLDPDAPPDKPWRAKINSDFMANAFFAHSARLTGRAAEVLGKSDLAARYAELGDSIADLTWSKWSEHARSSQTGCAVAIELGIAPSAEHPSLATELATLVREAGGAISTGFLGTPLVLPALSRFGHLNAAYLMLLRTEIPSWLYQVDQGATTVWERWDAIAPDGSIHDGRMSIVVQGNEGDGAHMLSFNHYAYGSVVDWVYQNVGGIALDPSNPGYQHVMFAPRPCTDITSARTVIQTGLGAVSLIWQVQNETFTADVVLPFGCSGSFSTPAGPDSMVSLNGRVCDQVVHLQPGHHHLEVSSPTVTQPG